MKKIIQLFLEGENPTLINFFIMKKHTYVVLLMHPSPSSFLTRLTLIKQLFFKKSSYNMSCPQYYNYICIHITTLWHLILQAVQQQNEYSIHPIQLFSGFRKGVGEKIKTDVFLLIQLNKSLLQLLLLENTIAEKEKQCILKHTASFLHVPTIQVSVFSLFITNLIKPPYRMRLKQKLFEKQLVSNKCKTKHNSSFE